MPTNPYTSQTISGYNASPPPDDASEVAANQVEWDKHKTKLGDPVKTLSEAINTQNLAAFAKTINTDSEEDNAIAGSLAFAAVNATVTDGIITPLVSNIFLDTESAAASDELSHIATSTATNGPRDGALLFLSPFATDHVVTLKDRATSTATGSIHLLHATDVSLDEKEDIVVLQKRGEDWYQFGGPGFSTATGVAIRGYIDGMMLANTSTDTANDIDVGTGQAELSNGSEEKLFDFDSLIIKRLDSTWATGSSVGGLPSAVTYAATTTYHVFALADATRGVEIGLDTSVSATNLLATATEFTFSRRIGAVLTGTATTVLQFTQNDNDFTLDVPVTDINANDPGTSRVTAALTVPSDLIVQTIVNAKVTKGSDGGTSELLLTALSQTDTTPTSALNTIAVGTSSMQSNVRTLVPSDTSAQIGYRLSTSAAQYTVFINTLGWVDPRGRNS